LFEIFEGVFFSSVFTSSIVDTFVLVFAEGLITSSNVGKSFGVALNSLMTFVSAFVSSSVQFAITFFLASFAGSFEF